MKTSRVLFPMHLEVPEKCIGMLILMHGAYGHPAEEDMRWE